MFNKIGSFFKVSGQQTVTESHLKAPSEEKINEIKKEILDIENRGVDISENTKSMLKQFHLIE